MAKMAAVCFRAFIVAPFVIMCPRCLCRRPGPYRPAPYRRAFIQIVKSLAADPHSIGQFGQGKLALLPIG